MGPFSQPGRRKYLFVAMDYFTKWAEVEVVQSINEENVKQFIFKNIICCFKVPLQIITDNSTQFIDKKIQEFCKENNIKLSFALIYHPQENGKVGNEKLGTWMEVVPKAL